MKHIARDLGLFAAISALVFSFALVCGTPFVVEGSTPDKIVPVSQQAQPSVFQGTISRNGERFYLRATSGQIYQLDDSAYAQLFEGRSVRITGTLDSNAWMMNVSRIDPA